MTLAFLVKYVLISKMQLKLEQYLRGLAIFYKPSMCEGFTENCQTSQIWLQFLKTEDPENISDAAV